MQAPRVAVYSEMSVRSLTQGTRKALLALGTGGIGGILLGTISSRTSPMIGGTLFVGLAGATTILLFPMLGLYLSTLVIPLERFGRFTPDTATVTISIMRMLGLLTLGAFLLQAMIGRWKLKSDAALNLYAAYWMVALFAVFFTSDITDNIKFAFSFLGNLLFLFLLINMVRDWRTARLLVALWLVVTVLIGLYTIYDWNFGTPFGELKLGDTDLRFSTVLVDTSEWSALGQVKRAVGPTSNPAVYGINLIMTLPFFAYFFRVSTHVWQRLAAMLGGLVVFYNIMLTNTRAVILLTVLMSFLALLRGLVRLSPGRLIAGLLAIIVMLPLLPASIYDRVLDPSNYSVQKSGTMRIRLEYWRAGLEVAANNLLTGTGVGNTKIIANYVSSKYDTKVTVHTAHNEFITSFIEVGLFGWLLLMTFLALLVRYSFRAAATFREHGMMDRYWFLVACQFTLVGTLLFGVQVDVLHFPLKGFWLVAGLTIVMHQWSRSMIRPLSSPRQTIHYPT